MGFFKRGQGPEETFDAFMTDLRNLASPCEFANIKDGMLLYKIADGLNQENLRDKILCKGGDITLITAIEMRRAEEVRKMTKFSSHAGSNSKEYVDIQDVHCKTGT